MAYAIVTVTAYAWRFFDDVIVYIESDPCVHTGTWVPVGCGTPAGSTRVAFTFPVSCTVSLSWLTDGVVSSHFEAFLLSENH